ncbi:hypothetical protein ACFVVA_37050 [Kitasatospora sp. NPDC058048]|uniref:hypothetical protein n=1 Tax=Kitasatospora sp. NPDC058048 TaxID=3346313 RepID=UPI0036DD54DE
MTAADYLEAVRTALEEVVYRADHHDTAACTWRWNPGHPFVEPSHWHGYGVEISWSRPDGWQIAGIRRDGTAADRYRLALATYAEPDWVAMRVWTALTTDPGNGERGRLWEGLPGSETEEVPYVGGPLDGRSATWQRTDPAELGLTANMYDGTLWPSGTYVLEHADVTDRPRFLWLGPTPLPATGRPHTHVLAWFPGDLLGNDTSNWQLFDVEDWDVGTCYRLLPDELTPDCARADLRAAVEDELGHVVLEMRAGTYTVAPVTETGEPGDWHTCPKFDVVTDPTSDTPPC